MVLVLALRLVGVFGVGMSADFFCPYNYDRCEHCTAEVTRCKPWNLPAVTDNEGWERVAAEHDGNCSFAITRNFEAHIVVEDREAWLVVDRDETVLGRVRS